MAVRHHQASQASLDRQFNSALSQALERAVRLTLRIANDINNFNSGVLSSQTKQEAQQLLAMYQKYKRQT